MVKTMRLSISGSPIWVLLVVFVLLLLLVLQPILTQMSQTQFQPSGELKTKYPGTSEAEWRMAWNTGPGNCFINLTLWIGGVETPNSHEKKSDEPCSKKMLEQFLNGLIRRFDFAANWRASFEALLALVRAL